MLAFSHIPMFDRMDHPSVPTTCPHATLATGGHSIPLPLPTIPYRHREAEVGSPSKSATAIPSTIVLLLRCSCRGFHRSTVSQTLRSWFPPRRRLFNGLQWQSYEGTALCAAPYSSY